VQGQHFCYFDPMIERLVLIPLTAEERSALMECDSGDAFERASETAAVKSKQRELLPELPTFKEGS